MSMQALAVRAAVSPSIAQDQALCGTCLIKGSHFCGKLIDQAGSCGSSNTPLAQSFETARPREIVCRAGQPDEHFYVICEGWAFRFHRLQDGRRHILSFLVAGDVVSNYSIFTGRSNFAVQALTEVRFCKFDRRQIRSLVVQKPEIFDEWLERNVADFRRANRTSVALGQLDAQERIAWFILELRDRLDANGAVNGDVMEFPLRQSHIADATGLTTVHVCRVISACRKQGIYAIEDGMLRILDLAALRRLGGVM